MKSAAYALAAVLALSGTAFAGNHDAKRPVTVPAQTVDQTTTGSITPTKTDESVVKSGFGSKLGIDVNPTFLPTFN